jgi:hypothetical protein
VPHISQLVADPGERAATFGGTRAGKSAFVEWEMREIQHSRPDAMQLLIDSKPRFRAETERGPFRRGRRDAKERYSSWAKGPIVPNSVVIDMWDEHPFRGIWKNPGEVAILQSGEGAEWKRMLALVDAFVRANIKGRERRIVVDEALDFTRETPGELTRRTIHSTALPELAVNVMLDCNSARNLHTSRLSSSSVFPERHCFIWSRMQI